MLLKILLIALKTGCKIMSDSQASDNSCSLVFMQMHSRLQIARCDPLGAQTELFCLSEAADVSC